MTESNLNLVWVVLFRTLQTALDAVPTLLCGLFIAGIVRGMISPRAIRAWFTADPRIGPVRAWFTGLFLPVCSVGVLPIAWELKRAGVSRSVVLTFLLSAPLANPFTLIYAFQRLEREGVPGLLVLAFLLIASFVILAGSGVLLGLWWPESINAPDLPNVPDSGVRRVGVVVLSVARGLNGVLLLFLIVGVFGAGLLAIVRGGALERAVQDQSLLGPVKLAFVSIPFQATPTRGMILVCESVLSGISVGPVFVFYLLGIGVNLGTLLWISFCYGFRTMFCALSILIGGALVAGYALPIALPNTATDGVKSCHFLEIESSGGYKVANARAMRTTVINDAGEPQWFLIIACAVMGGFWIVGLVSFFFGERGTITHVMSAGAADSRKQAVSVWKKPLSTAQRSLAGMVLVLIGVVAGLHVYYPAPVELLNQMDEIQGEFALALKSSSPSRQQAIRLVAQWKRLQSKLVIADLLRRGSLRAPLRESTDQLRTSIDRLRVVVADGSSPEDVKAAYRESRDATARCRETIE